MLSLTHHIKVLTQKIASCTRFSLLFAILVEVISCLQIIHVILAPAFDFDLKNNFFFSTLVAKITSYTGAIEVSDSSISDDLIKAIWFIFVIYLSLHLILFGLLLVIQTFKNQYLHKKLLMAAAILCVLHSRILFFPVQYFLVGIIRAYIQYNNEKNQPFYIQRDYLIATMAFILINQIYTSAIELQVYDINKTKNDYATMSNSLHQLTFLHKSLAIKSHFIFDGLGSLNSIEAIGHIILTFITIFIILTKLPFYKTVLTQIRLVLAAITLVSAFLFLLKAFSVDNRLLEPSWLLTNILLIKLLFVRLKSGLENILEGNIAKPEKAIHLALLVKENNFGYFSPKVYRRLFPHSALFTTGTLINHNNFKSTRVGTTLNEDEQEIYKHILERLSVTLSAHPKSVPLILFMARIYIKKLENIPQAMILVNRINKEKSLSIPLQNSIKNFYDTLKKVYSIQKENRHENLEFLSYFEYRNTANSLKEDIQRETQSQIDLWTEMKKEKVDVKRVIDLAYQIDKLSYHIQQKYQRYSQNFLKTVANSFLLYKIYAEKVRELGTEARKVMRKFIAIIHNQNLRHPLDVYSDDQAVMILSLKKETVGTILDASGSTQSFFQLEKSELIGQNFSSLLPPTFAKSHMKFIQNYAKTLNTRIDHQFNSYAKTKEGDLFEVQINLTLYPEIDREVKLMMLFQKMAPPSPIIILNQEGSVIEFSNIVKSHVDSEDITIGTKLRNVCAEYDIINAAFNIVFSKAEKELPKAKSGSAFLRNKTSRFTSKSDNIPMSAEKFLSELIMTKSSHDNEDINPERAKQLCNSYMQGNKLSFYFSGTRPEAVYDVQIEPYVLDGQLYKILTLNSQENIKIVVKTVGTDLEIKRSEVISDVFADDFPEEDEGKFVKDTVKNRTNIRNDFLEEKDPDKLLLGLKSIFEKQNLDSAKLVSKPSLVDKLQVKSQASVTKPDSLIKSSENPEKMNPSTSMQVVKTKPIKREMSVTSYGTAGLEAIKALKRIFDQKSTYPLRRNVIITVILFVIVMIALASVFYSFSQQSIYEHEQNIQIINLSNQRLSVAMKLWQYVIRRLMIIKDISNEDVSFIEQSIKESSGDFLVKNNELRQLLSTDLDKDRIKDIYKNDVDLWEPCLGRTNNGEAVNTFIATDILYSLMNSIKFEPIAPCLIVEASNDMVFLINNTANDFLVSSEALSEVTREMLVDNVDASILKLELILILQTITFGSFCLFLIFIIRVILQSYRRLFWALMKIEPHQISHRLSQLQAAKTLLEIDIESKKFGIEMTELVNEGKPMYKEISKKKEKKVGFSNRGERFTVRNLKKDLTKYVVITLLFITIPAILFYVSLAESISDFTILDELDKQLSITTKAEYQGRMIMSNFYIQMLFDNETSILIRNENPDKQLIKNLELLNAIHNEMLVVFFNDEIIALDPIIQAMLKDNICRYLPNPSQLVYNFCLEATKGETIGLLSVDANLISISTNYIDGYLKDPTLDYITKIANPYQTEVRPIMVTLEAAFNFLNSHILETSRSQISVFTSRTTVFYLAILATILLFLSVTYLMSIRRFALMDMGRGKILKLIPYQILTESRALDFYLNRDFNQKRY